MFQENLRNVQKGGREWLSGALRIFSSIFDTYPVWKYHSQDIDVQEGGGG